MKTIFVKCIFVVTLSLIVPLCYSQHLTAEATDSEIDDLELVTTYHCMADSTSDWLVIVPNSGVEQGTPLRVRLKGIPSSVVEVTFTLPSVLTGDGGDLLPSSWDSTGVLWREKNRYVNPRVPFRVEIASDSSAVLDLGIILSISDNTPYGEFVGSVICSATDTLRKDTARVTAGYDVIIPETFAVIEPEPGDIKNLSKGITYTLDPEKDSIQPVSNGNERGSAWMLSAGGQQNANVKYKFTLPDSLQGPIGTAISCSFASNSLYMVERNQRLDPDTSMTFQIDSLGHFTLKLGITVVIPSEARDGDYTGWGGCELSYVGWHDNKGKLPFQTTVPVTISVTVVGSQNVHDLRVLPTHYGIDLIFPQDFGQGEKIVY